MRDYTRGETNEARAFRMQRGLTRDYCDVQPQLVESEAKTAPKHDMPIDYDCYWRYVQGKIEARLEMHRVCWTHDQQIRVRIWATPVG